MGTLTYCAAISDGDGTVPPLGTAPVYFAIASAPDGSRPGLSIQNEFQIQFTTPLLAPASIPPAAPFNPFLKRLN